MSRAVAFLARMDEVSASARERLEEAAAKRQALETRRYLTTAEAAFYLGYTDDAGFKNPVEAFRSLAKRVGVHSLTPCRLGPKATGRKVWWFRKQLDDLLQNQMRAFANARGER